MYPKSTWGFIYINDNTLMAIIMTFIDNPLAINMSFQRNYGERFE